MAKNEEDGAEKIVVKSYGNNHEQTMTRAEFADFQKATDPQKSRFYIKGLADPEETKTVPANATGVAAPRTQKAVTGSTERTSAGNE